MIPNHVSKFGLDGMDLISPKLQIHQVYFQDVQGERKQGQGSVFNSREACRVPENPDRRAEGEV